MVGGVALFVHPPLDTLTKMYPYGAPATKALVRLVSVGWIIIGILAIFLPMLNQP